MNERHKNLPSVTEENIIEAIEKKFEDEAGPGTGDKDAAGPNQSKSRVTNVSDDEYLKSLGYKSELYRGFNAFMSFTMVFTSVGVICSNALVFDYGINTGGPVTLTWGWIIGSLFTIIIARSLAEITSTYPVSGSTYHWAGLLSKRKYAGLSSFICGWFSFLGNTACDASYAYGFAQIIAAIV
jgi:amino acid transporter